MAAPRCGHECPFVSVKCDRKRGHKAPTHRREWPATAEAPDVGLYWVQVEPDAGGRHLMTDTDGTVWRVWQHGG